MSQDIRKYFGLVGSSSNSKKDSSTKEKKRKKANVESDDEEPLPFKNKKNRLLASDSEDDDIFAISKKTSQSTKKSPSKKSSQSTKKSPSRKSSQSTKKSPSKKSRPLNRFEVTKSPPKLKPATASDFFGKSSVQKNKTSQSQVKEVRKVEEIIIHSDDEFDKTLREFDSKEFKSTKRKSQGEKIDSSSKQSKPSFGLASKLAAKVKSTEFKEEESSLKKLKTDNNNDVESLITKPPTPSKGSKDKESGKITPVKKENGGAKLSSSQDVVKPLKDKTLTPSKLCNGKKSVKITPAKKGKDISMESTNCISGEKSTISKENLDVALNEEIPITPEDAKKQQGAAYRKYLHRSGPRNPGSKTIPEGKPRCLSGLTFVMTGVLDSLDREEVTEIAKKYNGKVTSNISKNTSYLVVGVDSGDSKIKKAELIGTRIIDEDGFLNLISSRSDSTIAQSKETESLKKKPRKSSCTKSQEYSSAPKSPSTKSSDSYSSCSTLSESSLPSIDSPKGGSSGLGTSQTTPTPSDSLLWVDKYRPSSLKNIIGQQGEASNAKKLLNWLKNWFSNQSGSKKLVKPGPWAKNNDGSYFKAALLSGPPGVGKTTTAYLASKEIGFDTVEMNASVTRSKKCLQQEIAELLSNQSLKGFSSGSSCFMTRNHVLLMDEVDGMAGNEDRGGVQELILLIKNSKVPIICMCNDRNHPKIRSLANYCFDLRFQKPRIEQIRGAMMSVCFKEGIKLKPDALDQMIMGAKHDLRQVLHHLSVWSAGQKNMDAVQVKADAKRAKKDFKMGPWEVCQKVFNESDHKEMSIHDKVGLFFQDYSIGPLFVQENYLKVSPHCARGNPKKLLEQLAKSANVLADGDLVERVIRKNNAWSLLPVQALYSSVCPGEYMAGHFSAQIEFPHWLGNNSRTKKFDRLAQELHTHMRLRISGSKLDIAMDYSSRLQHKILKPLVKHGSEGVNEAVSVMTSHDLLREDLESLSELSKWPHTKDWMPQIESKVKAAFTRALNKDSHMNPYAVASISKSKRNLNTNDEMEEDENTLESENEDEEDISKDAMIRQGKKMASNVKASSSESSSSKKTKGGKGVKRKK